MPHFAEHLIRSVRLMLAHGLLKELVLQIWHYLYSTRAYVDTVLDVRAFKGTVRYPAPLTVRTIGTADDACLRAVLADRALGPEEHHEAVRRLDMLASGLNACYAVTDDGGNVRVIQWLIFEGENEAVRRIYGDWYPRLAADEALMENVYVFPRYRGTGILSPAVGKLVEVAKAAGAARIITAIPGTNENSLMSFIRMGFRPQRVRIERRRFGVASRTVIPVSACNDIRMFARLVAGSALLGRHAPEKIDL